MLCVAHFSVINFVLKCFTKGWERHGCWLELVNMILTSFLNGLLSTTYHISCNRSAPHEKPTKDFLEKKRKNKKHLQKHLQYLPHLEPEVLNAGSRSSQNHPACAVQYSWILSSVKLASTGIMFKNVLLSANIYTLSPQLSLLTPASLVFFLCIT